MGRRNDLHKSKAMYTLRKRVGSFTEGNVYENDIVTITNDGKYSKDYALMDDSNFRYRIRPGGGNKKRHTRGGWIKPDASLSAITWTKKDFFSSATITSESKIVLKPNYTSLKDFAYYGSAVELIRAAVTDVIMRFPGGIRYYDNYNLMEELVVDGEKYKYVSNEMGIDCWTKAPVTLSNNANPMRVLAISYASYVDANGMPLTSAPVVEMTGSCPNTIVGTTTFADNTFSIYSDENGTYHLVYPANEDREGCVIKVAPDIAEKFWDTLDDFEKVLLDRTTKPVYRSVFEVPHSNDGGYYYEKKSFVWPNIGDGFTPDVTSGAYEGYIKSLIDIASYYDEVDCDNMWRMLTHESIKNLDWTFLADEFDSSSDWDSSRIKAIIRIYGRQFDDLKRYADNVKATNSVTYDEKNNLPDYFLTDVAENCGWDARSVAPHTDNSVMCDVIYSGVTESGYTSSDANINFDRVLALNSRYIHSLKGTRRGLHTLLGLFGLEESEVGEDNPAEGTYEISEYVAIATKFPSLDDFGKIRSAYDYFYTEGADITSSFPVKRVASEDSVYIIPWYTAGYSYQNDVYFQEKGGWGRIHDKEINLDCTSLSSITETERTHFYGETEPYLMFCDTLKEMTEMTEDKLEPEMVCYVTDTSNMEYIPSRNDSGFTDYSHYFILKTVPLSGRIGFVDNEYYTCYGWKNVYEHEFNGVSAVTDDGARVLYQESLKAEYTGNNPHTGKGHYDDGNSYLYKFNHLFYQDVNDGKFDEYKDGSADDRKIYRNAVNMGFGYSAITEDNTKVHSFGYEDSEELPMIEGYEEALNPIYDLLVNPESGKTTDVSASYSLANIKNMAINFNVGGNIYLKNYITKVVIPYLEHMIPSTTISKYTFDGMETEDVIRYDIKIYSEVDKGRVICYDSVAKEGDEVKFTADGNEGYGIYSVLIRDEEDNDVEFTVEGNEYTFVMPASNVFIDVVFRRTHSITSEYTFRTEGGNVEFANGDTDETEYVEGITVEFGVNVNDGYAMTDIVITDTDGNEVDYTVNNGVYSFEMPDNDVVISVEFKSLFNISIECLNGSVSYNGEDINEADVIEGSEVVLVISTEDGYRYIGSELMTIEGNVISAFTTDNVSFTMPSNDVRFGVDNARIYSIAYDYNDAYGVILYNKTEAVSGETVEFSIDYEGYLNYCVVSADSGTVAVESGQSAYSFSMPASDVIVSADFRGVVDLIVESEGCEVLCEARIPLGIETMAAITPMTFYNPETLTVESYYVTNDGPYDEEEVNIDVAKGENDRYYFTAPNDEDVDCVYLYAYCEMNEYRAAMEDIELNFNPIDKTVELSKIIDSEGDIFYSINETNCLYTKYDFPISIDGYGNIVEIYAVVAEENGEMILNESRKFVINIENGDITIIDDNIVCEGRTVKMTLNSATRRITLENEDGTPIYWSFDDPEEYTLYEGTLTLPDTLVEGIAVRLYAESGGGYIGDKLSDNFKITISDGHYNVEANNGYLYYGYRYTNPAMEECAFYIRRKIGESPIPYKEEGLYDANETLTGYTIEELDENGVFYVILDTYTTCTRDADLDYEGKQK